ncbi:hypothetical protein HYU92_02190 [Candidatus Curtissbacteria bacterium]|nr:hypothetical protein [Candidatus Curtissbacteria bacterium]
MFGDAIHYASADSLPEVQIRKFSGANSGSILIFHDGVTLKRKTTHILEVLPQVLDNLKGLGLTPTKTSAVLS